MEKLFFEGDDTHPTIDFDIDGNLKIAGRALPENAAKFFDPIIKWVKNVTIKEINIEFNLDYYNTSVSKQLLDLFKEIENNKNVETINITWMYEDGDDEMLESGEVYEDLLPKFNFKYHKYAEAID